MLGGKFTHSLDAKNRIFLPAKLRDELGETLVVAQDLRKKCLKVFSQSGWANYVAPIRQQPRVISEPIMRALQSTVDEVSPDAQGRILIKKELVEYAGIDKTTIVIGCYDYAEIWAEENYIEETKTTDIAALASELEKYGL